VGYNWNTGPIAGEPNNEIPVDGGVGDDAELDCVDCTGDRC